MQYYHFKKDKNSPAKTIFMDSILILIFFYPAIKCRDFGKKNHVIVSSAEKVYEGNFAK